MSGSILDIDIPDGYLAMPLTDIDDAVASAETLITASAPTELASSLSVELPIMAELLHVLAGQGVRYCGVGRHLAPGDGSTVTSWLTVCVYDADGDTENPRLVLKTILDADAATGVKDKVELLDVDGRPMMFSEQVTQLPTPNGIPAVSYPGDTAPVYQLRAVVPSDDGSVIASIEVSTTFIGAGPLFQDMIIAMARSVEFRKLTPPEFAVSV